jgi:excisionase family DNA binding protein
MDLNSERLWSRKEVAKYFGVSELTVLRMIQRQDITAYKINGQWKFKKDDIDLYLKENSNRKLPKKKG